MPDIYRPPAAEAPLKGAPAAWSPWRALGVCLAVSWVLILARIGLGFQHWEISPYLWAVLEWMPVAMVAVFVGSFRRHRAQPRLLAWSLLFGAELTLVLPLLFFGWVAPILVAEVPSPSGFRLARTYASCWFVCDGQLYVGSRLSPLEERVDERKGSVPGDIVWSADGETASFAGPERKNDVGERACRTSQFFLRPVTFLMRCPEH